MAKTTYDLSAVHSSLGVKGQQSLPNIDPLQLDQVIVVGDVSSSFGAQRFESRGISSIRVFDIPNFHAIAQLFSSAAGGIVVERVDISAVDGTSGAPRGAVAMRVGVPTETVTPSPTNIQQVGGAPAVSRVVAANILGGGSLPANTFVLVILDDLGQKTWENFGWFIPPGLVFEVAVVNLVTQLTATVQWREIPQSAGSQ